MTAADPIPVILSPDDIPDHIPNAVVVLCCCESRNQEKGLFCASEPRLLAAVIAEIVGSMGIID